MNDITNCKEEISELDLYKEIVIECPKCQKKRKLKIPIKIINQSKQLTTISIPMGLCCEHSFQAFIDKNFKVRGYQHVDFDFSKMEIYEGGAEELEINSDVIAALERDQKTEEKMADLASLPLFQDIISLLRSSVDEKEILGSGIFTIDGHVLYSSLPSGTLTNTIREFEVRSEKKLTSLSKMYLELKNKQKICSNYMEIQDLEFVLVLFFSNRVKLGMGNLILKELSSKIKSFI